MSASLAAPLPASLEATHVTAPEAWGGAVPKSFTMLRGVHAPGVACPSTVPIQFLFRIGTIAGHVYAPIARHAEHAQEPLSTRGFVTSVAGWK